MTELEPKSARIISTILLDAEKITSGDRRDEYGDAYINHRHIAELLNVILQYKLKELLTAADAVDIMIMVKMARLMNGYSRNSTIDIAGYAKLRDEIAQADERRKNGV